MNDKLLENTESIVKNAVLRDPAVFTLLDSIEKLGCKIPENFFRFKYCDTNVSGGFAVSTDTKDNKAHPYISICYNHVLPKESIHQTLIHELIHAYDYCRVKNLTSDNCKSHACTEIRASSQSGECNYAVELFRGNFKYEFGHRDCVKRRASLSLSMNPYCKDKCKDSIEEVFDKCYQDYAPFDGPRG